MYYYIVNPAAGGGQLKHLQDKLRSRLDKLGIKGEWVHTTGPGDAAKMAAGAAGQGHTTVVAVGGDDTVNEVINGLVAHENVAIGIIPLGRQNRLATQLGIQDWQQACEVLAGRRLTPYSLIAAGQKFFLSTLTLGFETDLDKTVDTALEGWKARLHQLAASWGQARKYETLQCRIAVDDRFTVECDLFSLAIANQKFLNPLADNQLVITIAEQPRKRLQLGAYLWQLIHRSGTSATEETATTRFTARRVVIETTPSTGIMVDGKVAGRTPIAIRLTDRRMRFITEKVMGDLREAIGQRL